MTSTSVAPKRRRAAWDWERIRDPLTRARKARRLLRRLQQLRVDAFQLAMALGCDDTGPHCDVEKQLAENLCKLTAGEISHSEREHLEGMAQLEVKILVHKHEHSAEVIDFKEARARMRARKVG